MSDTVKKTSFIRVVTYNILAQGYIHPDKYSYVEDASILSREYRRPRLIGSAMAHGKVDILCFQEFDDAKYWGDTMMRNGYVGYYAIRHGKTDGCAIFWDDSKYRLVKKWLVDLNDLINDPSPVIQSNPGKFKRDNIGVIVSLETIKTGKVFCVSTTHLFWDPRMEDVKIHQSRFMLNSLKKAVEESGGVPWILAGDFNSTPSSNVYKYMTNKDLGDADEDYRVGCSPLSSIRSAYGRMSEPIFTNYTTEFKACIDYIFFDSTNFDTSSLAWVDESKFDGLTAIPSRDHSSDHIPLYAAFSYKDTTSPEPSW